MCTDEGEITEYWNSLDQELELEMDVLDDLYGEAVEVHKQNKWLTYGEPLHRLREWGVQVALSWTMCMQTILALTMASAIIITNGK